MTPSDPHDDTPRDDVFHPDAEPTYEAQHTRPYGYPTNYGHGYSANQGQGQGHGYGGGQYHPQGAQSGQYGQAQGRPQPGQYGHPQPGYGYQQYGQPYYGQQYGQQYGQPHYGQYGQPHYGQQYGYNAQYGSYYPQPAPTPSRGRRAMLGVGAAALAVGLVLAGVAIADNGSSDTTAQNPGVTQPNTGNNPNTGNQPSTGNGGNQGNNARSTTASAVQQQGIVTVVSTLGYQNAQSAGTGMIVSSDGEILTNNHVISGATSITVTVETTGRSYRADVVGTVPTKDVAVIKLRDASGLTTAKVGDSSDVDDLGTGDKVVGVGNAGGTGTLRASYGTVTGLEKSITASDESGASSEKLQGLIQINAGIISGDSGGPLYDSDGDIVGMDTAAAANSSQATAFAIPIDDAKAYADKIESGVETATVHIGLPAFIGVTVNPKGTGGAAIAQVLQGGPAAKAGLTGGSTITRVGSTAVSDSDGLKTALGKYQPGNSVSLTWTDASGQSHTATVTTVAGPAD